MREPALHRPRGRSRAGAVALLGFAACALWVKPMGLLFWARIRILTSIPRTAIADDPRLLAAEPPPRVGAVPPSIPLALPLSPQRDPFVSLDRASQRKQNLGTSPDPAGEAKSAADSVE